MQQTIGERLQQARQHLGLSIEEVAEKLKIRKQILLNFETNEFDINLPIVYKRGFFRTYVKFLKLNTATFLADFEEASQDKPSEFGFSFARLKPTLNTSGEPEESVEENARESVAKYVRSVPQFTHFRLFLGIIIGVFILFVVGLFYRTHKQHAAAALPKVESGLTVPETKQEITSYEEITLVALNDMQVFVREEANKNRLFSGSLKKDERHHLQKTGAVQVSYSDGNALLIEQPDGSQIRPQKAGRGWIRVP